MDVAVAPAAASVPGSAAAAARIEKCVHCGFCTAACPTYGLDGNELDSPRGRIYLVRELLADAPGAAAAAQLHLDRCLTCRSCETACPSGVEYEPIASFGRKLAEQRAPRRPLARIARAALGEAVRSRAAGRAARWGARLSAAVAPAARRILPHAGPIGPWPRAQHRRKAAVMLGCAQEGLMPHTTRALARLLDAAGLSPLAAAAPCCGAVRHHLQRVRAGLADAGATVAACSKLLDDGAEAIVTAASGCAAHMKTYPHLLAGTRSERAAIRVAQAVAEPAALLAGELAALAPALSGIGRSRRIAMHEPCTLRNALGGGTGAADLLAAAGFRPAVPAHPNCCGSAGTYSLVQRKRSLRLRANMADALAAAGAAEIASSNIGCILHLRAAGLAAAHWADLLAPAARGA